jgi:hypothetical protein
MTVEELRAVLALYDDTDKIGIASPKIDGDEQTFYEIGDTYSDQFAGEEGTENGLMLEAGEELPKL